MTVPFRTCLPLRIEYCSNGETNEYEPDGPMTGWILLGFVVFGAVTKSIAWLHQGGGHSDLGFVSQQWLAEHRVWEMSAPRR